VHEPEHRGVFERREVDALRRELLLVPLPGAREAPPGELRRLHAAIAVFVSAAHLAVPETVEARIVVGHAQARSGPVCVLAVVLAATVADRPHALAEPSV